MISPALAKKQKMVIPAPAPTPTPDTSFSNQILIPSLPNDISINILARVSRAHHRSLSLVSKAFHSLLSSPLFFTTRSLIKSTETSLFVTIKPRRDPFTRRFFTLCNGHLIPLPPIPCRAVDSAYAAIGPCIYVLGGRLNRGGDKVSASASADVWIFDCRFNKWAAGPPMHVARRSPMVGVVDGKLYVIGVYENEASAEIYDPDVGSWEAVETFTEGRIPKRHIYGSAVNGRKIYARATDAVVAYDVETGVREYIIDAAGTSSCCILNGVLYWCDYKQTKGLDLEKGHQNAITGIGLEADWPYDTGNMQVVNFDGKLVALWEKRKINKAWDHEIWYTEIDVKKGNNGELQGNVCFNDLVLWSPEWCILINCLAVAF